MEILLQVEGIGSIYILRDVEPSTVVDDTLRTSSKKIQTKNLKEVQEKA